MILEFVFTEAFQMAAFVALILIMVIVFIHQVYRYKDRL
jgi:hypothetical protein